MHDICESLSMKRTMLPLNNTRIFRLFPILLICASLQAQQGMMIDTVMIEREKQTSSALSRFKQQMIGNLRDDEYLTISSMQSGMEIDEYGLDKAEHALRAMGLFRSIRIEVDTIDQRHCIPFIVSREAVPQFGPGPMIQMGGGEHALGIRFETPSLFGNAMHVLVDARNRSENDIGWQGIVDVEWNTAFGLPLALGFNIQSHALTTAMTLQFKKKPKPTGDLFYGARITSGQGTDFLFQNEQSNRFSFESQEVSAWGGWLLPRRDDLYFTLAIHSKTAERGNPALIQAFDNTRSILFGFGSIADRTITVGEDDIPIGAWGNAVLGQVNKIHGRNGESFFYAGGTLEQSELTLNKSLYLSATISAGSGLSRGLAINTALDAQVKAHWKLLKSMAIFTNFSQKSVWNWDGFMQMTLDNDNGVRGIPLNRRVGANRMFGTLECRLDAISLPIDLTLGCTGFIDAGTVWNAGDRISSTRWSSAIGFGVVIADGSIAGLSAFPLLRVEYVQALQEQAYSGIVLSTSYAIPTLSRHHYAVPAFIGTGIDTE